MAIGGDVWLKEYEESVKLADEISQRLHEKNDALRNGEDVSRLVSAVRRKVTMLGSRADRLEALLKSSNDNMVLSEKELRRREDMLLGIRYKIKQMSNSLNSTLPSGRTALLGGEGKQPNQAVETEETAGLDNRGVVSLQRQMMREQDEELQDLESTVTSTKHIALAINGELDLHNRLLREMDEDVDSTNARMLAAQKKLVAVSKRASKTCNVIFIMLAIAGLVVVLIVLVRLSKIFMW